jgi:N-acyl-D-amino-acid deacylase
LRLTDRGRIAIGLVADITIFDPRTVIDRSDYLNPQRLSEGVRFVLVNGRIALLDGKPTGTTAGTWARRQKRATE